MSEPLIYFVGSPSEVEHHAAPLNGRLPICIVDAERVVDLARPGDLAVFYSEHFDRFRFACQMLKRQHVATLYLIDGILEWRNAWENHPEEPACPYAMRPVLAHKAACIGASQARILNSWGNSDKTEIVGIPRFDPLQKPSRIRNKREFHLLVMTAKTPGFSPAQTALTSRSLGELRDVIANLPDHQIDGRRIRVTWRLTAGLDKEIGVENQLADLSGRELADTLRDVDAVISTPSTGMLEAMRMGIPVAALDYHNCPNYLPTAWKITCRESASAVLAELIHPPASKLLYQESTLADSLQIQTSATRRLEELIAKMLLIAADQIAAGKTLNFPSQMLDGFVAGDPISHGFDHASIYPEAAEFLQHDVNELQVELSHARREIRHLQREKAQLKSELQQAHEIFEEIHQHPIAGPVVRIRQQILDWFSRRRRYRDELDAELNSQVVTPSPGTET